MACLVVPAVEAIVVTVAKKIAESKEKNSSVCSDNGNCGSEFEGIKFSEKLGWLSRMLWGGSALLLFEHVWHGEIVPWFPFLTNASNPEDAAIMLEEMAAVGGTMSIAVTAVWGVMLFVSHKMHRKAMDIQVSEN